MHVRRSPIRRARRGPRGILPKAGWVAAVCLVALAWAALPAAAQSAGVCGRTELVRASLVRTIYQKHDSNVTDCAQVTAAHLSVIRSVQLYWPYSRYPQGGPDRSVDLQAGDFAGLTDVLGLFADNVRIRNLPAGLFADLPGVVTIDLQHNEIERLPDDFLQGLPDLMVLRLNGKQHRQPARELFRRCTLPSSTASRP